MNRGQTLPMIGVVVLVLLGFTALAVDAGYLRYQQRIQQEATDSAALAGATEYLAGNDAKNAAIEDAKRNGFTNDGSKIIVNAVHPPSQGNYTGDSGAVEATINAQHPAFFGNIFGIANVPIHTRAVATVRPTDNSCVVMLDPSANTNFNKGTVVAPTCAITINGSANFNSSTVTAKSLGCGSTCSGGTYTQATPQPIVPVSDPCPRIPGCAYLTNHPPSTTPCSSTWGGGSTISPGCYGGLNMKNKTVTFNPGLYVVTGTLNGDGATLAGSGVTFYITGSGNLNLNNANMNFTAPTSGDYSAYSAGEQNVLFFQNPADTNSPTIQSATCAKCSTNLSGLLYFPTQTVNYNKSNSNTSGSYALLVFGSANFNKSVTNFFDGPSGTSLIDRVVLAE